MFEIQEGGRGGDGAIYLCNADGADKATKVFTQYFGHMIPASWGLRPREGGKLFVDVNTASDGRRTLMCWPGRAVLNDYDDDTLRRAGYVVGARSADGKVFKIS
jgi:hypothetical protein